MGMGSVLFRFDIGDNEGDGDNREVSGAGQKFDEDGLDDTLSGLWGNEDIVEDGNGDDDKDMNGCGENDVEDTDAFENDIFGICGGCCES